MPQAVNAENAHDVEVHATEPSLGPRLPAIGTALTNLPSSTGPPKRTGCSAAALTCHDAPYKGGELKTAPCACVHNCWLPHAWRPVLCGCHNWWLPSTPSNCCLRLTTVQTVFCPTDTCTRARRQLPLTHAHAHPCTHAHTNSPVFVHEQMCVNASRCIQIAIVQ